MDENSISNSGTVFRESILNESIKKRPKICSKFWLLSFISWIFLIFFGFFEIIIFIFKKNSYAFWNFMFVNEEDEYLIPIQMNKKLFILSLIIILIFAIFQLVFFLINSYFKNINVYDSMMGPFSKFHFFPLLCYNAVFIIGLCREIRDLSQNTIINLVILDVIISIFGLISLIFIYKLTKFKYEVLYKVLIIKKGTYSCLLALMIYHIWYSITVFEYLLKKIENCKYIDYIDKICIAFSVVIGLLNLILGLSLKDIILLLMSILINIGIIIQTNSKTIKIIDIIANVLYFFSDIYLIITAIRKRSLN